MTKELLAGQLAGQLHGREYPLDLSEELRDESKKNGLVIVYGASDDLCEFDGAIHDEVGCNDGGTIRFNLKGPIYEPDDSEIEVLEKFNVLDKVLDEGWSFEALWGQGETSWSYNVPFPHVTFDIMEDEEIYCRGFVFALDDLPSIP